MKTILIVQRQVTHYRKLLFSYLAQQNDYRIEVAAVGDPNASDEMTHYFPAKERVIRFGAKRYRLQRAPELVKFIQRSYTKYDYIILEGATNIVNNIPICSFLKKRGKPYIVWDAGRRKNARMNGPRRMAQGVLEYVWKNAAAIMAYSSLAKAYFTGIGIPEKKVFVCHNTLYVGDFDRQIRAITDAQVQQVREQYVPKGGKLVLYVGAVEPRKRVEDLIDAFRLVRKTIPDAALLVIGGGEQLEQLRAATENDDIFLPGPIVEGVIGYFLAADLFALPSEGGLSLNQAMICGKPVIASSADGTELDLIRDGENGFLFAEGNVSALADKIVEVLSDDARCTQMGAASRSVIDNSINEKVFYQSLQCCLNSVAKNGGY